MFKGGKSTKPVKKPGGGAALMKQMGFQMPNFDESGMGGGGADDDDDDDDLEAELQRLQQGYGGGQGSRGSKGNPHKSGEKQQDLQSIHKQVNQLLYDIDRPINDEELSDADDEDLLAELNEITDDYESESHHQTKPAQGTAGTNILSVLEGRQDMYVKALAAAKTSADASKSRRLERQLKTIQELLQSARAGAPIDESDIPPEVYVASQQAPARAPSPPRQPAAPQPRVVPPPQPAASRPNVVPPTQPHPRAVPLPQPPPQAPTRINNNSVAPRPQAPATTNADPAVDRLKALALQAKQQGDMAKAREYIIQLKALQGKTSAAAAPPSAVQKESYDNVPEDDAPPPPLPLKAPEPHSVMEALQQRLEELTKRGEEAATKGDAPKARRMERIAKQYEEAIDATRKNRPFDYNELPDLPGFAPIPVPQAKTQPAAGAPASSTNPKQGPVHGQARPSQVHQQRPAVQAAASTGSTTARKSQQAQTLRLKQERFQKLALQAKQQGDLETAKKFLIAYKGLDQMIAAAEAGLPIDMGQVPKLPEDDNNDLINDDDLTQDLARADRDTVYRRLQDDLLRQIQTCARNQQIYSQMEEPTSIKKANEHKALEHRCAQDLEKLRQCFQHGAKPPLFHYERRQMHVVQVNNDLGENDLQITILRGINLPVPAGASSSSLETYVTIEFPYPTETPQTARTRHAAGTTNAEYPESTHKFYIKRNDARFRRLMNRKELKLAVFYKSGFLRSDRALGVASIKLADLEQKCTIHESVDLFESEHKKKIEGKLEVKLRIREALEQTKASDILPQRWLVIDRFEDQSQSGKSSSKSSSGAAPAITAIARLVPTGEILGQLAINMAGKKEPSEVEDSSRSNATDRQQRRSHQPQPTSAAVSTGPQSVQVLNYEAALLQQHIEQCQDQLSPEQLHQLEKKHRSLEEESNRLVDSLRTGGKRAVQDHLRDLEELVNYYDQEAREHQQRRESKKVDLCLTKKKLVLKEIDTLTSSSSSSTTTSRF